MRMLGVQQQQQEWQASHRTRVGREGADTLPRDAAAHHYDNTHKTLRRTDGRTMPKKTTTVSVCTTAAPRPVREGGVGGPVEVATAVLRREHRVLGADSVHGVDPLRHVQQRGVEGLRV